MKQYRRSRPEASRQGVRRAKALLEGEKETGSGRRVLSSSGGIPPHPVLRGIEIDKVRAALSHARPDGTSVAQEQERDDMANASLSNLQKRQDFLRAMANFRPKETVFETFATGGQRDLVYNSQVDKCARGSDAALVAMKSMRRQMKVARDKGSALVIAGTKSAQVLNGETDGGESEERKKVVEGLDDAEGEKDLAVAKELATRVDDAPPSIEPAAKGVEGKRRLSKADRKKMKKDPNYQPSSGSHTDSTKKKRGADFRDNLHFIANDSAPDTVAAARSRQIEAAMQPSSSSNSKGTAALAHRIEENMLDIVGDENVDLVKRQRMMRWDKSKRKYIQTTVGEELSGDSKSKKTRLESGQLAKS